MSMNPIKAFRDYFGLDRPPPPDGPSDYDKGYAAGLEGRECWENPTLHLFPGEFLDWHAGWCQGRQKRNEGIA